MSSHCSSASSSSGEDASDSHANSSTSSSEDASVDQHPEHDVQQDIPLPSRQVEEEDLEDLSDISDNTDIFHVECSRSEVPRTTEDEDVEVILELKQHIRKYPLLPPDPLDPNKHNSFTNVHSAVRLPVVHCAIIGCNACSNLPKEEESYHWSMERWLYGHLVFHEHKDKEMKPVLEHIRRLHACTGVNCKRCQADDGEMTALAFYMQAVSEREREHMSLLGPSVDRRALTWVCRLANSMTIRSLMCFTCAQLHTHVPCWDRMFQCGQRSHLHALGNKGNISMYSVEERHGFL